MVTVENEPSSKSSHEAGWLGSEPDVAVLATCASPASERELLVLDFGTGSEAPAFVRTALRQTKELRGVRDDAILVASELVTNAVVHSGGSPADTIQVRAVLSRGDVAISMHDPGLSGDTPHVRDAVALQASGPGLRIVKQVARGWGFERDRGYPGLGRASHGCG
jgi:anti-sigma regulatory factor (Ser/Thr protein kinase)